MLRFVLFFHDCPAGVPRPTHCDLMFEHGGVLQSWALAELPRDWSKLPGMAEAIAFAQTNSVDALRIGDHRLAYLNYEGPVSSDRGSVHRLDAGTFSVRKEPFSFTLAGQFICGDVTLTQLSSDADRWHLAFSPASEVTAP